MKPPLWLSVPAIRLRAGLLGRRHRFPGDHRFIDRRLAFDQDAVDRHPFARANADQVADRDGVERYVLVSAVRPHAPRAVGRQRHQRADGAQGRGAGAQFQHLPEQHQHGDHRGGLEIKRDAAVRVAKRRRKQSGRESRHQAVDVSNADAHGDEREHIEMTRAERLDAAHKERPAAPQHHGRRQDELHKVRRAVRQRRKAEMPAHLQHCQRQCQRRRNPKASCHVGEFAAVIAAAGFGLERHAANGACAWPDLADFRMHRAGIDRTLGHRLVPRGGVFSKIFIWIGGKLAAAAGRAEGVIVAVMAVTVRARRRIDRHAAHRIDGAAAGAMRLNQSFHEACLKRIPWRGI